MWKLTDVVMLPTKEKATSIGKYIDTQLLVHNTGKDIPTGEMQHLYFLSDEEIKEGDWCLHSSDKNPYNVKKVLKKNYKDMVIRKS